MPVATTSAIARIAADFERYLAELQDQDRLIELPDGSIVKTVPFSIHWLVRGADFIGEASFRHVLTDRLLQSGGHIGYGIRPTCQGRGYGRLILALTLAEARARGLARVLVTAHEWNARSCRIIEANGGRLESTVDDINGGGPLRRYWIEPAPARS
jgi:predicted acetyltransferase